jgi:hypothetical protein
VTDPAERERLYWQRDHVRLFGHKDYPERLAKAGFEVVVHNMAEEVGKAKSERYSLGEEHFVYFVRKA